MARHLRFISRTVMVKNGDVDEAYKVLNRFLNLEGITETVKRKRYFEKPNVKRRRINYETGRHLYNNDMGRRINFLSRANREDPWVGY